MNNSARRAVPAVLWCAAVALGVSGCRVGGDDSTAVARTTVKASPAGCAGGEIRWGRVTREPTLIAVSRPVEVGQDDGWVTITPARLRELEPRIEVSGEGPSTRRLYASLAKQLKHWSASELAKPGTTSADAEEADRIDFHGAGVFATAQAVRAVDASFTADCPDGTRTRVYGSVSTYLPGTLSTSLACGYDPTEHGSDEPWVAEAYELACGDGP
ncbi:hypothetical protein OG866_28810 [Streptomyces sp. NBC_00663]|uniref:hypothetical protein n=1 Tax=Streptomyces sp. NBC_00663 TaxID=2975801 RepID=UPI002E314E25|nr:hypothetical protein [Streptomyces sp. NBC_00663]